jgi:ATP-dependent DNA helicase RecQ
MIRHTANYTTTNHNFVVQNLPDRRVDSEIIPAICIVKNILQRGKPTLMSKYLIDQLGPVHEAKNYNDFIPLISHQRPVWERIIRGDVKRNYNPAKHFFDNLVPKYFSEYKLLNQLIVPEVPINFITQINVDDFEQQQVDFFLPQAYLVIEIDGSQHDPRADALRDAHLKKFGIETYRFTTKDIESEGENFKNTIEKIRSRIVKVTNNIESKNKSGEYEEFVPTIMDYHDFNTPEDNDQRLIATAIMRFQLTVLDILEAGRLDMKSKWIIELKTDFTSNFEELALQDLKLWFDNILQLQKIDFKFPNYKIERVNNFSGKSSINIDFSIRQRYTDIFQNLPEVIFVRNDYFDYYLHFRATNAVKPEAVGFRAYDFFKISTTKPFNYKFKFQENDRNSDELALGFIMNSLYGYDSFRDGQLAIIANALELNSTLGLLPTGGGKSICFQLPVFLQPGISFVVCPIKALMFDQKIDLEKRKISRIAHITSEDDAVLKDQILSDFSNGQYQFIFIAPERFQIKSFRQYLQKLTDNFTISYAVIDEVHCLSEWGHDFRTSYLNLSKTITKYSSNTFRFIALTATASLNVLKDIKLELNIKDDDVKTLTDYSRPELDFEVIADNDKKYNELKNILQKESKENDVFDNKGVDSNAGIIFTNTVNGYSGCSNIARALTNDLGFKVEFFSGSAPKINGVSQRNEEFEKYKHEVQHSFKSNDLPLLVATKAFGMGVNKNNVSYTIHYGIPGSMESLYQEAGRAGRDKKRYMENHARCYVLFTEGKQTETLDDLWGQNTTIAELKNKVNEISGDLKSNFFMLQTSLEEEETEFRIIKTILTKYAIANKKDVLIESQNIKVKLEDEEGNETIIGNKAYTEKAIYRLTQLGIVEDWTVKNFFKGEFEVDFANFSEQSVKNTLIETISKYSDKNTLDNLIIDEFNKRPTLSTIDKSIYALLNWVNKHFVYNRRQSLKNIFEACSNFQEGDFKQRKIDFKNKLENYFKFNESSFVLQHISENSFDFHKWFEVFYCLKTVNQTQYRTNEIIGIEEFKKLQDNLSRFLESYANNIGLNFVSGIVRLMNNDFDNSDGKRRLSMSFDAILAEKWNFNKVNIKEQILTETCKIAATSKLDNRNTLAAFFIEKLGEDFEALILINECLNDEISSTFLVKNYTNRIKLINKKINEQFERIG